MALNPSFARGWRTERVSETRPVGHDEPSLVSILTCGSWVASPLSHPRYTFSDGRAGHLCPVSAAPLPPDSFQGPGQPEQEQRRREQHEARDHGAPRDFNQLATVGSGPSQEPVSVVPHSLIPTLHSLEVSVGRKGSAAWSLVSVSRRSACAPASSGASSPTSSHPTSKPAPSLARRSAPMPCPNGPAGPAGGHTARSRPVHLRGPPRGGQVGNMRVEKSRRRNIFRGRCEADELQEHHRITIRPTRHR